jgi:hypothetical protein
MSINNQLHQQKSPEEQLAANHHLQTSSPTINSNNQLQPSVSNHNQQPSAKPSAATNSCSQQMQPSVRNHQHQPSAASAATISSKHQHPITSTNQSASSHLLQQLTTSIIRNQQQQP